MMQSLFTEEALKNTHYKGMMDHSSILKEIKQASVCIFPSFAECLPVAWLEAMAMQKPIVASNIGWASEIIADGVEGFLVNPKDHNLYANKICKLLEDVALQNQFGKAAKQKIAQKFSMEIVAKQSLAFYKKIADN